MNVYFLVFDAGTGAGRCAVVDHKGRIHHTAYQEWEYQRDPAYPNHLHFDSELFSNTLWDLAKEALSRSRISGDQIRAVTVSSLREGVLFIDSKGNELYAGPNFDDRASEAGKYLEEKSGKEIYFTSGTYPPVYGYCARIKWFQEKLPDVFNRIHKILTFGDWIIWKLCGEFVAEPSLISSSGLFDIKKGIWAPDLCNAMDMNNNWLPRIYKSGETVGYVYPHIAEITGLKPHTPVVLAGGDTQCAMLGMGLFKPDQIGCVAGTTSPVQFITKEPIFDPEMHTWTSCYLIPNLWCLESNAIVTGLSLRWFRDFICRNMDYDQMNQIISHSPIGSRGTLAFLGAEIMDMTNYKGTWTGGFLFQVPPSDISLGEILRALWESIAYAIRGNIEQITRITGKVINELNICGGQTASDTGMQIFADVLGIPITIHSNQGSILGATACAASGIDQYASLNEAAQNITPKGKVLDPDHRNHSQYTDEYQRWISHYKKVRGL